MKYDKNIALKWFEAHGIPAVSEHRFDEKRKWRFDFAWVDHGIALEVEGGVFTGGRHTRGAGFLKDIEKYNRATVLGWRVLRTTPSELCMSETIEMLKAAMNSGESKLLNGASGGPQRKKNCSPKLGEIVS